MLTGHHRIIVLCVAILAIVSILMFLLSWYHAPKIYEGGASTSYTLNGTKCDIILCFYESDITSEVYMAHFSDRLPAGETSTITSRLCVKSKQEITYHWEDTPMESVEDIDALIEKTASEDPDAILNLYLPPVVFDKPITMYNRTANLYGSVDNEHLTIFTDTVRVETRIPQIAEFHHISFEGEGKNGIIATDSLNLYQCVSLSDSTRASGRWMVPGYI